MRRAGGAEDGGIAQDSDPRQHRVREDLLGCVVNAAPQLNGVVVELRRTIQ